MKIEEKKECEYTHNCQMIFLPAISTTVRIQDFAFDDRNKKITYLHFAFDCFGPNCRKCFENIAKATFVAIWSKYLIFSGDSMKHEITTISMSLSCDLFYGYFFCCLCFRLPYLINFRSVVVSWRSNKKKQAHTQFSCTNNRSAGIWLALCYACVFRSIYGLIGSTFVHKYNVILLMNVATMCNFRWLCSNF